MIVRKTLFRIARSPADRPRPVDENLIAPPDARHARGLPHRKVILSRRGRRSAYHPVPVNRQPGWYSAQHQGKARCSQRAVNIFGSLLRVYFSKALSENSRSVL